MVFIISFALGIFANWVIDRIQNEDKRAIIFMFWATFLLASLFSSISKGG